MRRLALYACEENSPGPGGPCRPAGRVAVYLPGGGRSRLDSHDRDQALQGFAAVRRRVASAGLYPETCFSRRCATKPQRHSSTSNFICCGGGELSLIASMAPCGWRVQFKLGKGHVRLLSFPDGESRLVRFCFGGAWNVAGRAGLHCALLILARKGKCPQSNNAEPMLRNTNSWETDRRNSTRRSAVHKNISRSWTALAHQLESLAIIEKEGT